MLASTLLQRLGQPNRVLLAGCGGGYDVLGAVPLLHELRALGVEVELASLSFAYLNGLEASQHATCPNMYAVQARAATERAYCPEAWLARWIDETYGGTSTIHSFDKTGVRPLAAAYRTLVAEQRIDAIVLIDGGIDAILRGDEISLGTPSEDLASLAAATSLDLPLAIACVGMTAELRDGIAHAQVFERIAELTRAGAYFGAAGLVRGMPACDAYVRAVEYVFAGQMHQKRSHVHSVITRAITGEFGTPAPHVWLSPLANMFWFLDGHVVAKQHLFLDDLRATDSIWDVAARVEAARKSLVIRERSELPI